MVVLATSIGASHAQTDAVEQAVAAAIDPVMKQYQIPGMAVAVTVDGKHRVYSFGVASRATNKPVTGDTVFEIGSVSKTFTATLGAYAQARGALSLDDPAVRYLPALAGSALGGTTLRDLATYTAGGLPLQVPDTVADMPQMIEWLRQWQPEHAPGSYRRYSNVSIGLFGYLAAKAMNTPFRTALSQQLLPKLGLMHTWLEVPSARMGDYAWGYDKHDKPVRVTPGVFDAQAYGIKTTATDMIRFVELNIDASSIDDAALRQALSATHAGYVRAGVMTQGLGWERYRWPTTVDDLLAGNDARMVLDGSPAQRIEPPEASTPDVLINKTGSTNGFGSYAAFIPARRIGVVLLANRNYPVPARIEAAWKILNALGTAHP